MSASRIHDLSIEINHIASELGQLARAMDTMGLSSPAQQIFSAQEAIRRLTGQIRDAASEQLEASMNYSASMVGGMLCVVEKMTAASNPLPAQRG